MNYWLIKFAPRRTSWTEIVKAGSFTIRGVRNPQARNNLRNMSLEDRVLHYHSQEDLAVVGMTKVVKEAFPDPTASNPKWMAVTFEPIKTLPCPVPLNVIRETESLGNLPLITQPRLSVMPLSKNEFDAILKISSLIKEEQHAAAKEAKNAAGSAILTRDG